MVGNIAVVGVLRHCALYRCVCDYLKADHMNVQHSLIQELMVYEFEMDHNTAEATKNICCAKGEGAIDHDSVSSGFKKFCSGYKTLDDQKRSGRPKVIDTDAVLQAIESNLMSNFQRVSGELGFS